jgi:hypothetical protein
VEGMEKERKKERKTDMHWKLWGHAAMKVLRLILVVVHRAWLLVIIVYLALVFAVWYNNYCHKLHTAPTNIWRVLTSKNMCCQ